MVKRPDVTITQFLATFLEREIEVSRRRLKFSLMTVLFVLWSRAFHQGHVFSPIQVEDRASLDARFEKEEGFFIL